MENKWGAVCASLPPGVRGHLRGYVVVNATRLDLNAALDFPVQLRIRWWGEISEGVLLQPEVTCDGNHVKDGSNVTACYAVRSGLKQVSTYLRDILLLTISPL